MTLKYVQNIMGQIMKALLQSCPQGLTSDVLNDYIHPPKPCGLKLFFHLFCHYCICPSLLKCDGLQIALLLSLTCWNSVPPEKPWLGFKRWCLIIAHYERFSKSLCMQNTLTKIRKLVAFMILRVYLLCIFFKLLMHSAEYSPGF